MWPFNKLWFWLIVILDILLYKYYSKIIGPAGELWVKLELKKLPKEYIGNKILLLLEEKYAQK